MGEELEKKPEKLEEEKKEQPSKPEKDAKKEEDKTKSDESKENAPPPEIILRVYMHCEGCARKVRRCLKGFQGVEGVVTDCRTSRVVVTGEKADPAKVLERIQRKSHRQVELISPIPKPPSEEKIQKPVAKIEEPPLPLITVVLRVYMHCEACSQEIKKRILRMKGVESAEPDLKTSQVTVSGAFLAEKLTDYVYRRTGKHATIVKVEAEKKEEEKAKEEEKVEEKESKKEVSGKEEKESGAAAAAEEEEEEESKIEMKRQGYYNYNYNYSNHQINNNPMGYVQAYYYGADPQIVMMSPDSQMFSDENPNACSVM